MPSGSSGESAPESSPEDPGTTAPDLGEQFSGRVITAVYESYEMEWDDISVIIIGSLTYTDHYEGETEFALIGYRGSEEPLLLVGCTKEDGSGEYYAYCFDGNRVYQAEERLKGTLYYNWTTKEFAVEEDNQKWSIYTSWRNHIIWLREETSAPEGFERMPMTSKNCSPPPMEQNIRSFIFY